MVSTVLVAIALAAGGVAVGKASRDSGPTAGQLKHATADATRAKRDLSALKTGLGARVSKLEASHAGAVKRLRRAENVLQRWRDRATFAERRLHAAGGRK